MLQSTDEIKQSLEKFTKNYQTKKLSSAKNVLMLFWPEITEAIKNGVPKGAVFNFLLAHGVAISRYQFLKVVRDLKKTRV